MHVDPVFLNCVQHSSQTPKEEYTSTSQDLPGRPKNEPSPLCPLCQNGSRINRGSGVDILPLIYVMKKFLEELLSRFTLCDGCEEASAVKACLECQASYCLQYLEKCHSEKRFVNHAAVPAGGTQRCAEDLMRTEDEKQVEAQTRLDEAPTLEEGRKLEEEKRLEKATRLEEEARRLEKEEKRLEEARKLEEDKTLKVERRLEEEARRLEKEARRLERVARRLEKEKRLEEARRLEEEGKQAKRLEVARKLEEENTLKEARRLEEETRRLEETKKLEEKKRLEETRLLKEEAGRLEEVVRKLQEEKRVVEQGKLDETKRLVPSGSLIDKNTAQRLLAKINNRGKRLQLLYRASADGWSNWMFHDRCDNKGPTFTIAKSNTNVIFGGYTSLSWASSGCFSADASAFLFRVNSSANILFGEVIPNGQHVNYTVYRNANYGPTFGWGHDLYLQLDDAKQRYASGQHTFSHIDFPECSLVGSRDGWGPTEVEVFGLADLPTSSS